MVKVSLFCFLGNRTSSKKWATKFIIFLYSYSKPVFAKHTLPSINFHFYKILWKISPNCIKIILRNNSFSGLDSQSPMETEDIDDEMPVRRIPKTPQTIPRTPQVGMHNGKISGIVKPNIRCKFYFCYYSDDCWLLDYLLETYNWNNLQIRCSIRKKIFTAKSCESEA